MTAIQDLGSEGKITNAWVDDLMRLLGWHEPQRTGDKIHPSGDCC
jgi:hypothetical protein